MRLAHVSYNKVIEPRLLQKNNKKSQQDVSISNLRVKDTMFRIHFVRGSPLFQPLVC